ncbi:hypothetical protein [Gramella sp. Hel_I_59]|uniref:hypothetical protein n=1 Tax=Gramella sp. Hel_I_59 TaxID=1249978 RepID=UPI00163B2FF1|nr:hypothetical protein [Gramella sp. Hel_I_59]
METLQYVESEFRKCDRIKAQSIKDGLTMASQWAAIDKLKSVVSELELKDYLRQNNAQIAAVRLEAEEKKKQPWWKTALYILTALMTGYGIGSAAN